MTVFAQLEDQAMLMYEVTSSLPQNAYDHWNGVLNHYLLEEKSVDRSWAVTEKFIED